MAGDWIKMRVWIARDPKVLAMTDYLAEQRLFINWLTDPVRRSCKDTAYEHVTRNVTRCVTVVGLLQVWGVANEVGRPDGNDLVMRHANLDRIDEIADVPCFGDAMQYVGWAVEEEDTQGQLQVRFPNFLSNNIPVEDRARTSAADRQRRYRERRRQGNPEEGEKDEEAEPARCATCVTRVTSQSNGREEKIREESRGKNSPTTPSCSDQTPSRLSERDASSPQEQSKAVERPAGRDATPPSTSPVVTAQRLWGKPPIQFDAEARRFVGITDLIRATWREAYPAVDLDRELARMVAWIVANPRKGRKSNYLRFCSHWLDRQQDRGGSVAPAGKPATKSAAEIRREKEERQRGVV